MNLPASQFPTITLFPPLMPEQNFSEIRSGTGFTSCQAADSVKAQGTEHKAQTQLVTVRLSSSTTKFLDETALLTLYCSLMPVPYENT